VLDEDFNTRTLSHGSVLWHYTNFAGLKGILLDGVLWASSLPYLNDTEEFRYGIKIALNVAQQELALAFGGEHGVHASAIHQELVSFFDDRYAPRDVFVASLSTERDDLSQWRAYGGAGPMFSIGFDPKKFEHKADEFLFSLEEVKYLRKEVDAELRRALKEPVGAVASAIRELGPQRAPGQVRKLGADIARELLLLVPHYKDPKFAAEKEWRLVRRQSVLVRRPILDHQFRQSGSLIVPYLAMPLHELAIQSEVRASGEHVSSPICEILIGPSPHPDELNHAVGEMTSRHGIVVKVTNSEVPFRNW
jgi:hypothetical protein